jgi:hypothetical protein
MLITNVDVYGLNESIIASGYPMRMDLPCQMENKMLSFERAIKLGNAESNSGHCNFLKGVVVQFDITYSQAFTPQLQRYKFLEIVSSMSKMHRIHKMNLDTSFNEHVLPDIKVLMMNLQKKYNDNPTKENWNKLLYNCPLGLMLTMRCSTNYLSLKNIFNQRKNHKLDEWKDFCKWIIELPRFQQLTGVKFDENV